MSETVQPDNKPADPSAADKHAAILKGLLEGTLTTDVLSGKAGITTADIDSWMAEPENAREFHAMLQAQKMQHQMFIARAQMMGAVKLVDIVSNAEHPIETVRKACVDLHKIAPLDPRPRRSEATKKGGEPNSPQGPGGPGSSGGSGGQQSSTAAADERVLRWMDHMTRMEYPDFPYEDDEGGDQARIALRSTPNTNLKCDPSHSSLQTARAPSRANVRGQSGPAASCSPREIDQSARAECAVRSQHSSNSHARPCPPTEIEHGAPTGIKHGARGPPEAFTFTSCIIAKRWR